VLQLQRPSASCPRRFCTRAAVAWLLMASLEWRCRRRPCPASMNRTRPPLGPHHLAASSLGGRLALSAVRHFWMAAAVLSSRFAQCFSGELQHHDPGDRRRHLRGRVMSSTRWSCGHAPLGALLWAGWRRSGRGSACFWAAAWADMVRRCLVCVAGIITSRGPQLMTQRPRLTPTRFRRETHRFDVDALEGYLRSHIPGFAGP